MAGLGTDEPPPVRQNVTAVNGFAYGTIGADIHTYANGEPLYLLANWQPEPAASRNWLRELPSRMLNARRAVVPFTGRDQELADLAGWRDAGAALAVRWLYGPGGRGKTRLAAELAAGSAAAGWKVVAAVHGPDADPIESGSQDLRLDGAAGLLLVVDYADRWLLTNLTWLLRNALLHHPGVATRILMIARTADAWPRLRDVLDGHEAASSAQLLPALAGQSGERAAMFTAARASFAAIYQLDEAHDVEPPGPLDDEEFGLTLAVHMAALVAVDARVMGGQPPSGVAGLTLYLLDREQLHWARLFDDRRAKTAGAPNPYRTPPEVMNQAVFTASLTGTLAPTAGKALLESLHLADPEQVLDDHAFCYPRGDATHATVLEPLYPDRLAEDFLALTMPGHAADYPARPWAAATCTTVLARDHGSRAAQPWTPRAVTFLASAASRWPHLGSGFLYRVLQEDPQLAIDAGSAALTALADLPSITPALLEAVDAALPGQRNVDLDLGVAAIASRATDHLLAATDDPAEQARIQHDLGVRLYNAGFYDRAGRHAREAARLYRQLAAADPAGYEHEVAGEVDNVGVFLAEAGRQEEAFAATDEAVRIWRRLTTRDPAAFEPGLAGALTNLGVRLSAAGRREEALAAAKEAVEHYRHLAGSDLGTFEPVLATSADNLGFFFSRLGRREEALAAAREAAEIRRRLAASDPATFDPDLAQSAYNVGRCLADLGRPEEALAAAQEALEIRRRLAAVNPVAFEPKLADSLLSVGARLGGLGRRDEALAAAREAADMLRRLADGRPDAFEADLADALDSLGIRLADMGQPHRALTVAEEAVQIRRRLAAGQPAAFEPGLADALDSLGLWLREVGRRDEALAATDESVRIYRRLAEARPAAFEPDLGRALSNLGVRLWDCGRHEEALAATEEAMRIQRRLAGDNPAAFEPDLAHAVNNLGGWLADLGRMQEGLPWTQEAVRIRRRLAEDNPAAFEPVLADSLSNLGVQLSVLGRREAGLAAAEEAVRIRRRLAEANPAAFDAALADSLTKLANRLSGLDRHDESLAVNEEVVRIRRRLAVGNPAVLEPLLADALAARAWFSVRASSSDLAAALDAVKESVKLYLSWPDGQDLEFAFATAAEVLDGLGRDDEAATLRRLADQDAAAAAALLQDTA